MFKTLRNNHILSILTNKTVIMIFPLFAITAPSYNTNSPNFISVLTFYKPSSHCKKLLNSGWEFPNPYRPVSIQTHSQSVTKTKWHIDFFLMQ